MNFGGTQLFPHGGTVVVNTDWGFYRNIFKREKRLNFTILTTRCNSSINKAHISPNEYAAFPCPRSGSGNKFNRQRSNRSGNKLDKEAIVPVTNSTKKQSFRNLRQNKIKNDCLQTRSETLTEPQISQNQMQLELTPTFECFTKLEQLLIRMVNLQVKLDGLEKNSFIRHHFFLKVK